MVIVIIINGNCFRRCQEKFSEGSFFSIRIFLRNCKTFTNEKLLEDAL